MIKKFFKDKPELLEEPEVQRAISWLKDQIDAQIRLNKDLQQERKKK